MILGFVASLHKAYIYRFITSNKEQPYAAYSAEDPSLQNEPLSLQDNVNFQDPGSSEERLIRSPWGKSKVKTDVLHKRNSAQNPLRSNTFGIVYTKQGNPLGILEVCIISDSFNQV